MGGQQKRGGPLRASVTSPSTDSVVTGELAGQEACPPKVCDVPGSDIACLMSRLHLESSAALGFPRNLHIPMKDLDVVFARSRPGHANGSLEATDMRSFAHGFLPIAASQIDYSPPQEQNG